MQSLAIVPARKGSTRLQMKNIYPLIDKPLIRWIVESVTNSNIFSKILISTDSDTIFSVVKDLPVERHYRNAKLASSTSTVLNSILDIMRNTAEHYETISYFLPTCPFTSTDDILSGYSLLNKGDCDTVIGMTEISETIQLSCLMSSDGSVLPIFDNLENNLTNSKYIKKYYKPSGAFYMGKWEHVLHAGNFFKGKVKGLVMPMERCVDINTIEDIQYAQILHNMLINNT